MLKTVPDVRDPKRKLILACTVQDFGARGDGVHNDRDAFQKALDYARSLGGGTVYAPAGAYRIEGTLAVPRSVYLAGVWQDPDEAPGSMKDGTLLLALPEPGIDKTPFITLGASAGVMGLTVYYPEQKLDAPVEYAATIHVKDTLDGKANAFSSVYCTTLVNPYYGLQMGPQWNELHFINRLRMSPLWRGAYCNMCTDVGRIQGMTVSAKYWAVYEGLRRETVAARMKESLTALVLQRTDGQNCYDLLLEDCRTGILFERDPNGVGEVTGANGQFSRIVIRNAATGISGTYSQGGCTFSMTVIEADGSEGSACVAFHKGFIANNSFYNADFANPGGPCFVLEEGNTGTLIMHNTTVHAWGEGHPAIRQMDGFLQIINCTFEGRGRAVYIGPAARGAILQQNDFADRAAPVAMEAANQEQMVVDLDTGRNAAQVLDFTVDVAGAPVIPGEAIVSVLHYGAVADGRTDDTAAFQKGFDALRETGGTLYVPAGYYLLRGNLRVPTGVELRGVSESMHHTNGVGSMILIEAGHGREEDAPFLTMEAASGLFGLTFWYPEQDYNAVVPYPWAVRVEGQDVYIRNVTFGNAYKGIDMMSCDCGGHYLDHVCGCFLSRGIAIGGSTKRSWVLNCHYNPHFYFRTNGTGLKGGSDGNKNGGDAMFKAVLGYQDRHLQGAFIFGETTEENVFNTFVYRSGTGLILTGGFDGVFYGFSLDGAVGGTKITGHHEKPVRFINLSSEIVPGENPVMGNTAVCLDASDDTVVEYLCSKMGSFNNVPPSLVTVKGGTLRLYGFFANVSPTLPGGAIHVERGSAEAVGILFNHEGPFARQEGEDSPVNIGVFTRQGPEACDFVTDNTPEASLRVVGAIFKDHANYHVGERSRTVLEKYVLVK